MRTACRLPAWEPPAFKPRPKQLAHSSAADALFVTNTRRCSYTSYNPLAFRGMKGDKFAAMEERHQERVGHCKDRNSKKKSEASQKKKKQAKGQERQRF